MAESTHPLPVETIGANPTRLWGISIGERVRRIGRAAGLEAGGPASRTGPRMLASAHFAWDPAWLKYMAERPGMVLTLRGEPVLAHARDAREAGEVAAIMAEGRQGTGSLAPLAFEDGPTIENQALRKRETPFVMQLRPDSLRAIERASFFGIDKGVSDILTRYLWPEGALVLTRVAARLHMTPNQVTTIGAILCVAATVLFARGEYWLGMALGLGFMVLDTVDGKLARCTITSSRWGNVFDHSVDLIHPPFWWWFWAMGLATWGLAYDTATFWWVQGVIQGGYLAQLLIEGVFLRQNGMMNIHVWQRFDSRFRLITARRNPNMVILFVSMLFARPDLGLIAVAGWTAISCAVHAVRLVQASLHRARGGTISSWLSDRA